MPREDPAARLLSAAEARGDELLALCRRLLQAPSENPPGDTTRAAAVATAYLDRQRLPYQTIAPQANRPNLVASFEGTRPGPHLVLNGHLDTFPAGDPTCWSVPPFGGEVREGRLYGRGVGDMKAGLASLIVAYASLAAHRDLLAGRLTLTVVSDEESFGPWGARYLVERHPEVLGDALLSAEPSSPWLVRCGERGMLWARIRTRATGAHGALALRSRSAIRELLTILAELPALEGVVEPPSDEARRVIEASREGTDRAFGEGAAESLTRVTLNLGTISGGLKVNVVAPEATAEIDLRLPLGASPKDLQARLEAIVARHPGAELEYLTVEAPSFSDPTHPLFGAIQDAAERVTGTRPLPAVGPPGTDSRLWRYRGIAAAVYGPRGYGVGAPDEHVLVSELLAVNRTHTLAAYRYLAGGPNR